MAVLTASFLPIWFLPCGLSVFPETGLTGGHCASSGFLQEEDDEIFNNLIFKLIKFNKKLCPLPEFWPEAVSRKR